MTTVISVHVTLVVLSLLMFLWRGLRMWVENPIEDPVWRRVVPDTVDTLLLLSGILLAYLMQVAPWDDMWLAVKLTAIVVYILAGFVALAHTAPRWLRRTCFMVALLTVVYIVAVAHTMQVRPWA